MLIPVFPALMRGYQIPTSTTQQFTGPMPGAYGASPLQSALGVASLFGAPRGGTSAAGGVLDAATGAYDKLSPYATKTYDYVTRLFD